MVLHRCRAALPSKLMMVDMFQGPPTFTASASASPSGLRATAPSLMLTHSMGRPASSMTVRMFSMSLKLQAEPAGSLVCCMAAPLAQGSLIFRPCSCRWLVVMRQARSYKAWPAAHQPHRTLNQAGSTISQAKPPVYSPASWHSRLTWSQRTGQPALTTSCRPQSSPQVLAGPSWALEVQPPGSRWCAGGFLCRAPSCRPPTPSHPGPAVSAGSGQGAQEAGCMYGKQLELGE